MRENGIDGDVRGISFDCKWFGQIWMLKYRNQGKAFFSVSNASWVVGVQQKGESFRVSAISGCVNVENSRMNQW